MHYPGGLSTPREDYWLSHITQGDYLPLERIITNHALPWGIILLAHYPGDYPPLNRIISFHALPWEDYQPLERIIFTLKVPRGIIHP